MNMTTNDWPDAVEAKPAYDWTQPLTIDTPVVRVSGAAVCGFCGQTYYKHPMETRVTDYDGHPFLHRSCDGRLLKL